MNKYYKTIKIGDMIEIEGYIVYEEGKSVGEECEWAFYNLEGDLIFTNTFIMPDIGGDICLELK